MYDLESFMDSNTFQQTPPINSLKAAFASSPSKRFHLHSDDVQSWCQNNSPALHPLNTAKWRDLLNHDLEESVQKDRSTTPLTTCFSRLKSEFSSTCQQYWQQHEVRRTHENYLCSMTPNVVDLFEPNTTWCSSRPHCEPLPSPQACKTQSWVNPLVLYGRPYIAMVSYCVQSHFLLQRLGDVNLFQWRKSENSSQWSSATLQAVAPAHQVCRPGTSNNFKVGTNIELPREPYVQLRKRIRLTLVAYIHEIPWQKEYSE